MPFDLEGWQWKLPRDWRDNEKGQLQVGNRQEEDGGQMVVISTHLTAPSEPKPKPKPKQIK